MGKRPLKVACPKPRIFRNTRFMYAFAIPLVGFLADKAKTVKHYLCILGLVFLA